MLNHIGILATGSAVFEVKKPLPEIRELVQQLSLSSSFILLSQLSTEVYDEKEFRNKFKEFYLNQLSDSFKENPPPQLYSKKVFQELSNKINKIENTIAFSSQSILNMWKWLLAYGNPEKLNSFQEVEINISGLYYLSLITNDYLYSGTEKSEELYAELFSNIVFNNHEYISTSISRTFLIYTIIAKDKSLYRSIYIDINTDFEKKYGYSIKQHLAIIFGLISSFLKPNVLGEKWLQNIDESFSESNLYEISQPIISSLIIDFKSSSEWALENIHSSWNFQKFREKPLLLINEKQFLPFSLKILQEQLFTGLFHKVRHIYPLSDKSFLDFYGKPFEKYAQLIIEKSIEQTRLAYKIIPEFRYKKTKDSPDIMLRLGNKLLAIEVKSYRLRLASITDANKETINLDTHKMIIEPLKQVHDRVKELLEINHESVSDVDEIYLMVVTQGHFPTIKPYEEIVDNALNLHFEIPINGYYHLDIEEFEMLCVLLERKRPIFKALNNKNNPKNRFHSFKNFLIDNDYHIKNNKFLGNQFGMVMDEIRTILFDN